ncbi:diadenylate cyclase [Candidatus Mycoplasma pogonae]
MNELLIVITVFAVVNFIFNILVVGYFVVRKINHNRKPHSKIGKTTKASLIFNLEKAIRELSKTKTGALITIQGNESLDNLRTDGVEINANISSDILISIFNKHSPLHDGAVIIQNNRIVYASTYFKITGKSISNKYGARHRAAMGISEQSDSVTIVISETNGNIGFAKAGNFKTVAAKDIQQVLNEYI